MRWFRRRKSPAICIQRPALLLARPGKGVEQAHLSPVVRRQAEQQCVHARGVEVVDAASARARRAARRRAARAALGGLRCRRPGDRPAGRSRPGPGGSGSGGHRAPSWGAGGPARPSSRGPACARPPGPRWRPAACPRWPRWLGSAAGARASGGRPAHPPSSRASSSGARRCQGDWDKPKIMGDDTLRDRLGLQSRSRGSRCRRARQRLVRTTGRAGSHPLDLANHGHGDLLLPAQERGRVGKSTPSTIQGSETVPLRQRRFTSEWWMPSMVGSRSCNPSKESTCPFSTSRAMARSPEK